MDYHRVTELALSTPWAIQEDKLAAIAQVLALRSAGVKLSDDEIAARIGSRRSQKNAVQEGSVVVLSLQGVIAHRMNSFAEISGGTSTERFRARVDQAIQDPDVSAIVIDCDSPGGSVAGVEELAAHLQAVRGQKRIIAVSNSLMASAAYWISASATEVVCTPSGEVGSIGVFMMHQDFSKAFEEAGIKNTIIRAGRFKAEGNPYEPLTEEAEAAAQAMIDEYYGMFVGAVARGRGISEERVRSGFGEGRTVSAKAALAEGMIDRVATIEEVLEDLGVSATRVMSNRLASAATKIETVPDKAAAAGSASPIQTLVAGTQEAITYTPEVAAGDAPTSPDPTPEPEAPEAKEEPMSEELNGTGPQGGATTEEPPAAPLPSAKRPSDGPTIEVGAGPKGRERAAAIAEICAAAGIPHRAGEFLRSEKSAEDVTNDILAEVNANLASMRASVDMTPKEAKRYSITRAIMAIVEDDWSGAGLEAEVHQEIASNLPKGHKTRGGIFVPTRGHFRGDRPRAALESGTGSAGGDLVFTESGDFIDLLRARMRVLGLGATSLVGLEGNVAFPKQIGAGTASWVGEDPGSDVADSDSSYAQVALNPHTLQSSTAYSRQLLAQGSIDVDVLVRNDLAMVTALAIDAAAINGSGAGNEPRGVLNTAGIGAVAIGTNGGAPTYDHIVDLETEIATDNADIGTMAYLTTPGIRGKLKKTQQFDGTNGMPVWAGSELNGYRGEVSTQVPSGLTKGTGTNLHALLFGVWAQLILGYWGAYELVVDPYTLKKQALIELTSFQMAGLCVRHPESFSAVVDADPTA